MSVIWKDIPGYPSYQVNESGHVRLCRDLSFQDISQHNGRGGYKRVNVRDSEGNYVKRLVHRLVALAFIGPPPDEERIFINHKDGNVTNNHYKNLEWVTSQENSIHALENKLTEYTLRVRVYNVETGEVILYTSMAAAATNHNITIGGVKRLLARYPEEKLGGVYTFEPLIDEHDPADFEHCQVIVAYDYVSRKNLVADTLGVMSILTGVLPGTIRLNVLDKRYRLIGGFVFKYLSDETPFPEYSKEEAKTSRDKYLLRKSPGGEIVVMDYSTGQMQNYPTVVSAAMATGLKTSHVMSKLNNKILLPCNGFSFKRKEDPSEFPVKSLEAIAASFMGARADGKAIKVSDIKTGESEICPSIKAAASKIGAARSAIKTHLDKQTDRLFKKRYMLHYV